MPHVVLTDDDELFRESLGLNLSDEGYDVTSFANGHETLTYLQEGGEADVLLLDWRMPELTGIDVLRRLRRAGIGIPVIFLTALSDDIYEQAALASKYGPPRAWTAAFTLVALVLILTIAAKLLSRRTKLR